MRVCILFLSYFPFHHPDSIAEKRRTQGEGDEGKEDAGGGDGAGRHCLLLYALCPVPEEPEQDVRGWGRSLSFVVFECSGFMSRMEKLSSVMKCL